MQTKDKALIFQDLLRAQQETKTFPPGLLQRMSWSVDWYS